MLYVAGNLATGFGEVFGDIRAAAVCPSFRVALVRPTLPLELLDVRGQGTAMRVGALPSLATGHYPRSRTQEWARAIYEDQPVAGRKIHGIYYDAAHSNGPALALWNTVGQVEVLANVSGAIQDFALTDQVMWPRIVAAAIGLGMDVGQVDYCHLCA